MARDAGLLKVRLLMGRGAWNEGAGGLVGRGEWGGRRGDEYAPGGGGGNGWKGAD